MKLKLSQIKEITTGAIRIDEVSNGIEFYRFSKEQDEFYQKRHPDLHQRSLPPSSVKMHFKTDSRTLSLSGVANDAMSCSFYSFDVFVNGEFYDSIDNFSDVDTSGVYAATSFPLGEFSKTFSFDDGIKEVAVYFPCSVRPTIYNISVDDGAFIEPIKQNKKLLCYGDSITQGMCALHASKNYATILADALGAEILNKGVGGERFVPELLDFEENFDPDYITVAYGTNNWWDADAAQFKSDVKNFFSKLVALYPKALIYAVLPIWRADMNECRAVSVISNIEEIIKSEIIDMENVVILEGMDLVPQSPEMFADAFLHPNDEGFIHYGNNLYRKISEDLLTRGEK